MFFNVFLTIDQDDEFGLSLTAFLAAKILDFFGRILFWR